MHSPELISPGSLESQGKEMGTYRVQMICVFSDIFTHLLPKSGQLITTGTCPTLNGISSLSRMPEESQQGDPDWLVEISNDFSLFLSSRKQILHYLCLSALQQTH